MKIVQTANIEKKFVMYDTARTAHTYVRVSLCACVSECVSVCVCECVRPRACACVLEVVRTRARVECVRMTECARAVGNSMEHPRA
jgi:hypothetical protein